MCRTIQINGKQHYLWRAVDQDGEVVGVLSGWLSRSARCRSFSSVCRIVYSVGNSLLLGKPHPSSRPQTFYHALSTPGLLFLYLCSPQFAHLS